MLPIFKSQVQVDICTDQKHKQHMLATMIHDGLPWYEDAGQKDQSFMDVVMGMNYGSIANAIEACSADEIAEFIYQLATIIDFYE